jgi:hypothetical protein
MIMENNTHDALVKSLVLISRQGIIIDLLKDVLNEIESESNSEVINHLIDAARLKVRLIEEESDRLK